MKPIAWSCWNEDMPSAIITFTEPDKYGWQSIKPLYTTPQTKPLSDEEIDKVASIKMNQILMDLIDSEDWNKGCTKQHLVNFARAIEERHGIK